MKKTTTLLLSLLLIICTNAQNSKLDSVSLINNTLYQYKGGTGTTRGSVIFPPSGASLLRWDSAYQSFYSFNSTRNGTTHPGTFNYIFSNHGLDSATNASANILIGQNIMAYGKFGSNNVALGWEALKQNTGNDNVGISEDALRDNLTGSNNVAIGRGAMNYNLNGRSNMAVGYNALQAGLHNNENVTMGDYSGAFLVTGDGNVFIGSYAGESNGSDNVVQNDGIAIGRYAGIGGPIGNRSICIGYNTQTNGDDQLNIGRTITGTGLATTSAVITVAGDFAATKSVSLSNGYKVTADDTGLTIVTPTAGIKHIAYDALITQARATTEISTTVTYPKKYMAYTTTGQALYLVEIK